MPLGLGNDHAGAVDPLNDPVYVCTYVPSLTESAELRPGCLEDDECRAAGRLGTPALNSDPGDSTSSFMIRSFDFFLAVVLIGNCNEVLPPV